MDTHSSTKPGYRTWELHARPIGAAHEPWRTMRVAARSALQAQAILRRLGYETVLESAITVSAQPDTMRPATLQPLVCARCGYELVGLTIESASVICPECSFSQPLVTWSPEMNTRESSNHPLIGIFAVIGMVGVLFVLFIIFMVLLTF